MKGYWFSDSEGWTKNMRDHMKTPAEVGRTHKVGGEIVPCYRGLHASPTPLDALNYACGGTLWEVEIPETAIPHGNPVDKYVSHTRKYIRRADISEGLFWQFASQCALDVIHLWDPPAIVKEYLADEAQGIDRSDIRAAAWDAARAAATTAATAAAAARAAAGDAAAATTAAGDAAREKMSSRFSKMVMAEFSKR